MGNGNQATVNVFQLVMTAFRPSQFKTVRH
jgi:hypothetical protein